MNDLNVIEICAGAGGQSLGLHLAGFRHSLAIELDDAAAETLRHNMRRLQAKSGRDFEVRIGDVADRSTWVPEEHRNVSLLAGGVPCPPFSVAGKQLGATDERDLFAWSVEAAGRMGPSAVLLENVRGLSMPRFSGYRQAVLDRFAELGYVADWKLLNACDFGVPQLRPRFVLVALRPEFAAYFHWPEPQPTAETVGSTLKDLMAARGWPGAESWARRANQVAPTIVGGSKKHGGPDLGPTRARASWARLGVDGLGVANAAPGPDEPDAHRPKLTTAMIARLQGWNGPDYEWEFLGRKTSVYRQIGNAFPPPVARSVGRSIVRALRKEASRTPCAPPPEYVTHDEVYQVLRQDGGFVSLSTLQRVLSSPMTKEELRRRIRALDQDFILTIKEAGGELFAQLGEWRAFRGQEGHARNEAFASPAQRARIS